MRMTPCESCPARLASTRLSDTRAASSAGTPPASNRDREKDRNASAEIVGTVSLLKIHWCLSDASQKRLGTATLLRSVAKWLNELRISSGPRSVEYVRVGIGP